MKFRFILFVFFLACFFSCKKQAGPGGQASIKGKIFVNKYNRTLTTLISSYYGADEYVYLVYGDNVSYDRRIKTSYDGAFEFLYLRQGKYKVYVYSLDTSQQSPSGQISIVKEVELSGRKEHFDLGDIVIAQ